MIRSKRNFKTVLCFVLVLLLAATAVLSLLFVESKTTDAVSTSTLESWTNDDSLQDCSS